MLRYPKEYIEQKLQRLISANFAITDEDHLDGICYEMHKFRNRYVSFFIDEHTLFDAICMAEDCNNLTVAPCEETEGLCERCGKNTVAASTEFF